VTPVPGSSFYREGGGRTLVRFVFCKTEEILVEAARRLRGLGDTTTTSRPAEPAIESGLQR
jgi:aspartate/methionine/tyrosine aminotransferase